VRAQREWQAADMEEVVVGAPSSPSADDALRRREGRRARHASSLLLDVENAVREAVGEALAARPNGARDAVGKRLAVRGDFLCAQLRELRGGGQMMGERLSELLRSLIRGQLRALFEGPGEADERGQAALRNLPAGEAPFLGAPDARLASKVLANALYELHEHAHVATNAWVRKLAATTTNAMTGGRDLLQMQKDAIAALPELERYELLCFAEAHATLLHFVRGALRDAVAAPEWRQLQRYLQMVVAAGCAQEALYLPLRDLRAFEAALATHEPIATTLGRALHAPGRTRSCASPGP
jgi:hypothetical protein